MMVKFNLDCIHTIVLFPTKYYIILDTFLPLLLFKLYVVMVTIYHDYQLKTTDQHYNMYMHITQREHSAQSTDANVGGIHLGLIIQILRPLKSTHLSHFNIIIIK